MILNLEMLFLLWVNIIHGLPKGTLTPSKLVKKSQENSKKILGIPLWSQEDYSTNYNPTGAGCLARILNVTKNYLFMVTLL
jgi:hypothetical protein